MLTEDTADSEECRTDKRRVDPRKGLSVGRTHTSGTLVLQPLRKRQLRNSRLSSVILLFGASSDVCR